MISRIVPWQSGQVIGERGPGVFHVAELLGRDQRLRPYVGGDLAGWRTALEREGSERWGDLVEREDVIDRNMPDRAARHLIAGGIARILNDREAAAALDRPQPCRPVVQETCEHDANHPRRTICRRRTEQRIDRRTRSILPRPPTHMDMVVADDQMTIGWRDVDVTGCEGLPPTARTTGKELRLPSTRARRSGS